MDLNGLEEFASEISNDILRLSVVFEHVDKLLTVVASLHHKLFQAPRLSEEIFNDYYDYYQPKTRISSAKEKSNQIDTKVGDSARGMDAFTYMKASHSGAAKEEPVKIEQESLNKPIIKSDPSFEMN